jgi:hypothetical protein
MMIMITKEILVHIIAEGAADSATASRVAAQYLLSQPSLFLVSPCQRNEGFVAQKMEDKKKGYLAMPIVRKL